MTQLFDYFNMRGSSFPDAVGIPFCRSFQLRVAAALAFAVMFFTSPALIGSVKAQLQADTYTVSGTVADAQNGESLVGATIFVPALGSGLNNQSVRLLQHISPSGQCVLGIRPPWI